MGLDPNSNYIVSGIERSGTSLLMQMLSSADVPVAHDDTRPPDDNNPKGYYELVGGKIINVLMDAAFPFDQYTGTFIKITAYGLKYLPPGKYKIIYSERDIEEILDSMEHMAKLVDRNRDETKQGFLRLNTIIKNMIKQRNDCEVLFINYNQLIKHPEDNVQRICSFLRLSSHCCQSMIRCIDKNLYRQRHHK